MTQLGSKTKKKILRDEIKLNDCITKMNKRIKSIYLGKNVYLGKSAGRIGYALSCSSKNL